MDELIAKQTAQGLMSGANLMGGPSREKAQTIVESMMKLHHREFAAWKYLRLAMERNPPTEEEEAALWELVCRARRERY